jgi:hypothetical protein
MHAALAVWALAGIVPALSPIEATAAVVATAPDVADTFVTTGPTNDLTASNYGAAGALSIAAAGKPRGEFQSLLRFDLSSAKATFDAAYGPGNWTIQSATLQLTAASPNNPLFNATSAGSFAVRWLASDSWDEGTGSPNAPTADGATYARLSAITGPPDTSLGTLAFAGSTSGQASYDLSLPAAFTSDLSSGGLVSLQLSAADISISYVFNSRNFPSASARPVLSVTAVPEPAAASFLALAALSLATRRRRR